MDIPFCSPLPVRLIEAIEHCGMQAYHGEKAFDRVWKGDTVSSVHCISFRGKSITQILRIFLSTTSLT